MKGMLSGGGSQGGTEEEEEEARESRKVRDPDVSRSEKPPHPLTLTSHTHQKVRAHHCAHY